MEGIVKWFSPYRGSYRGFERVRRLISPMENEEG